jgi:hypothetical protein
MSSWKGKIIGEWSYEQAKTTSSISQRSLAQLPNAVMSHASSINRTLKRVAWRPPCRASIEM